MIGVMGLGIFSGFMHFSFWGIQENIIHVGMGMPEGTGHLQIFDAGYFQSEESKYLEYGISGWQDLSNRIEAIEGVGFAAPRIDIMGMISNGEKSEPVIGFAVDPVKEKKLPGGFGSSGPYLSLEKSQDGIILGQKLAKKMNVKEGDYLTLMSTTVDGAINAIDLKFVGKIKTGTPDGDQRFVLINLQPAMDLVQSEKVRKIVVFLEERGRGGEKVQGTKHTPDNYFEADVEKYTDKISAMLPKENFTVKTWYQLNPYYDAVKAIYNTIFGFVGFVMAVVVILSLYNTMFMAVVERTTEIGTLMSVGTPRKYILILFLLESLIIGLTGVALGYAGSCVMAHGISNAGLMMPPPPGATEGYPLVVHTIYTWWFLIALFILMNTAIACFMPAFRASRMSIVKALYHV